jgi:hypothetical protein
VLEAETDKIFQTIIEHIPQATGGSVSIKDLLAADIPYAVKTFFRNDVDTALLNEQRIYHKTSRFNLDHPEVRSLQNQINSLLVLHYSFSTPDFLRQLSDIVHLTVNYLIRPQWTMVNVLFENEQSIPAHILTRSLQYFGSYEYFKEITGRYLEEKQINTVSKESFKALIWKIDAEFIRRKSGDEIAKITQPLYDFFDYPQKTGLNALPMKALIRYFEDKGLIMVLPRLEGEIAQGRTVLTQKDLAALLEDARRTLGSFQAEHIESDDHDLMTRSSDQTPGTMEQLAKHSFNFESAIPESEKRRFIKRIFAHDEQTYTIALQVFNTITTWKDASKYIDELFIRYDVDPYSSEAKKFIEVIFSLYHAKVY